MLQLLAGTFAFFWTHTALWFYREYKDRKERKSRPHVKTDELLDGKYKGKHYQRFPLIWRIAHLTFALSLMILTLTGMSVLYADTAWAPVVMQLRSAARRWRPSSTGVCAVMFAIVFFVHLIYIVMRICAQLEDLRLVRARFAGPAPGRTCGTSSACSSGSSAWARGRCSTAGPTGRSSTTGRRSGA